MSSIPRSFFVLSILAAAVPALSAEPPHMRPVRTISVAGQGEAFGKPDLAEINAGVQTFADTVVEASRENQAIVDRIFAALDDQGIDEKDIQTANYSVWAEQDYPRDPRGERDSKPRIAGYRVSNMVHVKVRDIDRIGEVLAAVTDAGANSINGIQFSVENRDPLEARARELAMADARSRAEALAKLAGVELGEVLAISMSSAAGQPPRPYAAGRMVMEMASQDAPAPGIVPGQQSVAVNVDVSYAIR